MLSDFNMSMVTEDSSSDTILLLGNPILIS